MKCWLAALLLASIVAAAEAMTPVSGGPQQPTPEQEMISWIQGKGGEVREGVGAERGGCMDDGLRPPPPHGGTKERKTEKGFSDSMLVGVPAAIAPAVLQQQAT